MKDYLLIQRDMVRAIISASDPLEIPRMLLNHALILDEIDTGAIFFIDRKAEKMILVASQWQTEGEIRREIELSADICSFLESENYNCINLDQHPHFKSLFPYGKLTSIFVIPAKDDGKTMVLLVLGSFRSRELSSDTCIVLETISAYISHSFSCSRGWQELEEIKAFTKLHSETSTRFIGLDFEKVDEFIDNTLVKIGEITGVDEVKVFMSDDKKESFFLKHKWCSETVNCNNEHFDDYEVHINRWLIKQLQKGKTLCIEDIEYLPAESDFEKEVFRKMNTASLVMVPLLYGKNVTGGICISSSKTRKWSGEFMDTLQLMGDVFVNALENKRKETEAKEKEMKYRTIFENIHDVYFETKDGKIITISPSVKEHLGFDPEEVIGREASILYLQPQEKYVIRKKLELEGSLNNYILKLKTKDSRIISVSLNAHTVFGNDGKPEKIAGLARDVTELTEIEKMQVEARLLLENAANVKKDFVSTINHELRTPLSIILGFSDILLSMHNEPLSASQKKYITNINDAALKLFDLINSLIQISEIEDGKMEIDRSAFSLPLLIEDIQHISTPFANKKEIDIGFNIDHDIKTIYSDRSKLKLILLNLINNAIKFTAEKGTVSISIQKHKDDSVHVTVKDNGIGIPEDEQKKLFQPFVQLEPVLTRTHEGTGLGLALAKEFIEIQGGKIWVTSEPEIGSTFEFILPIRISYDHEDTLQ